MIKYIIIVVCFFCAIACGPAKENKENMDRIAKRTADSIQSYIDSALTKPLLSYSQASTTTHTNTYIFHYK